MEERVIRITYDTVTPESAAEGDYSDSGWVDEDGICMEPEDPEEICMEPEDPEETATDIAIDYLRGKGLSASSSEFHKGIWYTEDDPSIDYATGEERRESFHLYGFSESEEREIFNALCRRRWWRKESNDA